MKLTDIDLNDKTEVAAAHALLAAILGQAIPPMTITQRVGEISQTSTGSVSQLAQAGVIEQNPAAVFAQPGQLPAGAQPLQDAAAVFGGQSATPLPGVTGLPATGVPALASGLPNNGGTSGAPGVAAPPPPSFVSAEGAAQGLPTQAAAGVELDSKGLPWDGRIHASTKSKKKDGAWTALRGLNDAAKVAKIEAELRAQVQGGAAPLAPQPAGGLPGLGAPMQAATAGAISGGIPASAGPTADPTTFEQLMPRVTQATIAGVLPPTALQAVCGALGLPSVVALQTNPAYVPHAWAQLKAAYPALQ